MKGKLPHPLLLQSITKNYSYDPLTGHVSKDGKIVGRGRANYILISVNTEDPIYLNMQCSLPAHRVAWYLTYVDWPEQEIDHIDGDGKNNKLANLRLATLSQNGYNRRKTTRKCSSQYKGVYYSIKTKKWLASIKRDEKIIRLGSFSTELEAAQVYDEAAIRLHGEFARPNFTHTTDTRR
jgi:hypothetical protein